MEEFLIPHKLVRGSRGVLVYIPSVFAERSDNVCRRSLLTCLLPHGTPGRSYFELKYLYTESVRLVGEEPKRQPITLLTQQEQRGVSIQRRLLVTRSGWSEKEPYVRARGRSHVHRSGDRLGKRPPGYMGDVSHRHLYEASVKEGGVREERMVGDLSVGAVLDDG